MKVAIFKDTYPEDKVTENDQDCIMKGMGKMLRRTPIGELPHLKSNRLEVPTISLVSGSLKLLTIIGWDLGPD
jgi:hypothetical protein